MNNAAAKAINVDIDVDRDNDDASYEEIDDPVLRALQKLRISGTYNKE